MVIAYLRSLASSELLSIKELTLKSVPLEVLVTACRCPESIHLLDLNHVDHIVFVIQGRVKRHVLGRFNTGYNS